MVGLIGIGIAGERDCGDRESGMDPGEDVETPALVDEERFRNGGCPYGKVPPPSKFA